MSNQLRVRLIEVLSKYLYETYICDNKDEGIYSQEDLIDELVSISDDELILRVIDELEVI